MMRVEDAYESLRQHGELPATYEVIYGAGCGAAGRFSVPVSADEARIAPGSIRRRTPP